MMEMIELTVKDAVLQALEQARGTRLSGGRLAEQLGVRPAYIQEMLDYYTQAQGVNFSWELKKRRRARETQEALEADPLTEATRLELSQYIDIENDITESAAQQMLSIIAAMKGKPKGGPQ